MPILSPESYASRIVLGTNWGEKKVNWKATCYCKIVNPFPPSFLEGGLVLVSSIYLLDMRLREGCAALGTDKHDQPSLPGGDWESRWYPTSTLLRASLPCLLLAGWHKTKQWEMSVLLINIKTILLLQRNVGGSCRDVLVSQCDGICWHCGACGPACVNTWLCLHWATLCFTLLIFSP